MIENNKAWRSAETVRREWLAQFITRKTPPAGAEQLICAAVVGGEHALTQAISGGHRLLCQLSGGTPSDPYSGYRHRLDLADQPRNAKAETMLTLAATLCAWEAGTRVDTWRHPSRWDHRIMTALTGWGYPPSEVEQLLTQHAEPDSDAATDENPTADLGATSDCGEVDGTDETHPIP